MRVGGILESHVELREESGRLFGASSFAALGMTNGGLDRGFALIPSPSPRGGEGGGFFALLRMTSDAQNDGGCSE